MTNKPDYGPSFPIARLERRTSQKGATYFSGYLGGARITLLKSKETGRDECEVWHLMVAEGKLWPLKDKLAGVSNGTDHRPSRNAAEATQRPLAHAEMNDEIPL